jgi:hypothetical protein
MSDVIDKAQQLPVSPWAQCVDLVRSSKHPSCSYDFGSACSRCTTLQSALFDFVRTNESVPGRSSMMLTETNIYRVYYNFFLVMHGHSLTENMQHIRYDNIWRIDICVSHKDGIFFQWEATFPSTVRRSG